MKKLHTWCRRRKNANIYHATAARREVVADDGPGGDHHDVIAREQKDAGFFTFAGLRPFRQPMYLFWLPVGLELKAGTQHIVHHVP